MNEIENEVSEKFLNHIKDIQAKGTDTPELFDMLNAYRMFLECVQLRLHVQYDNSNDN